MSGGGYFVSGDDVHAIVADIGAHSSKLGFAGEDSPKSLFRSNVAIKRNKDSGKIEDMKVDHLYRPISPHPPEGTDTDHLYHIENPVHTPTGLIGYGGPSQYDLLEHCINYGFQSALRVEPKQAPFLLVERSYNPPPLRQQLTELLFESLQVPAAFLGRDATMACYACGRTTATVVDIGSHSTTVSPVFEGYVEQKGVRKLTVGTTTMDETIMSHLDHLLLQQKKPSPYRPVYQRNFPTPRREEFHRLARLEIASICRQEGSGAAVLAVQDPGFTAPSMSYQLPDGTEVDIPSGYRFGIADLVLGNQDKSVQLREDKTEKAKQEMEKVLVETQLEIQGTSGDGEDGKDDNDDGAREYFRNVLSDTAAVGLLKRRTDDTNSNTKMIQKPSFRHTWPYLRKACGPYLSQHAQMLTASPIAAVICDAASRCDRDQQAPLLSNVVLAGGGACIGPTEQALPEHIREQVEAILHQHTPGWRVKCLSPNFPERAVCSWLGGSILGSLGTFHDMWITKKEYEEWGTAIVNKKCP